MNINDINGSSQLLDISLIAYKPSAHALALVLSQTCVRANELVSCGLESEDHWCYCETFNT